MTPLPPVPYRTRITMMTTVLGAPVVPGLWRGRELFGAFAGGSVSASASSHAHKLVLSQCDEAPHDEAVAGVVHVVRAADRVAWWRAIVV